MNRTALIALVCVTVLGACSNPMKTGRYLLDPPAAGERLPDRLGTVELKDVSLPDYAAGDEIAWQSKDGAVRIDSKSLWADKPGRAFTIALASTISSISGATVIAEPWPLAEQPRRRLQVTVEKALAEANGTYRLRGRYFISDEAAGGSNQARSFDIVVPLTSDAPEAIARAQSQAITQLARQIATLSGPGKSIRTSTPKADPIFSTPLPGFEGI